MEPPQKWLITGGAGYVGAHIADLFLANGKDVVVYDSLRSGLESRIEFLQEKHRKKIPMVVADIRDVVKFEEMLSDHSPDGVIHTAALKSVGESIEKPDEYIEVNFEATRQILESLIKLRIHKFIFSSTAAVYGSPNHSNPIKEYEPKNPISPYGASKLAAEEEVNRYLTLPDNRGTSLRFFNVVGTAAPELKDNSVENLVPIVINKLKAGEAPIIYGTNYPTPDGTCIRDYVDVRDVARAHFLAAYCNKQLPSVMNIGTGEGTSVKQVIELIGSSFSGGNIEVIQSTRRPGDPAYIYAEVSSSKNILGFTSNYNLADSIRSLFR